MIILLKILGIGILVSLLLLAIGATLGVMEEMKNRGGSTTLDNNKIKKS